uniref:KIAA1549 ortholog n=1 Tax=Poecilia formosa TaxID=48698 RepID=A0A096LSD7_POEFO
SAGAGSAEDQEAGAQGIHLLLRPPDLLPWEQGPSLEEAWGSGDYLETLSFMVPDGEELGLATPLPSHPWDAESDGDWVSYDTAFPPRPTLPLFSRPPIIPSSTPTVPLHTHTAHLDVFSTWDEEYDPEDMMPLEPTEVLLPDMNSLEYYTNLLAREKQKEKEREKEDQIHGTKSRPSITPTTTQTHLSPLTPVPTLSGPPPDLEHKHPPRGPFPPVTPSPALTSEKSPTLPNTSQTPSTPAPPSPKTKDHGPGLPPRPPSNTTSQVPPPPPLGPPVRPVKPERPSVITEKTAKPPAITTTTQITSISLTRGPPVTTPKGAQTPLTRQYLCNVTKPELYLVRVVSSKGSSAGFSHVRDVLRREFNRSIELQFLRTPSSFAFRVVSGPMIFTAVSVINALRQSPRSSGPIPTVSPLYTIPDLWYQIHSVLQFVPTHVDVRVCNFSERVERGLIMAYAESRRRSHEGGNITVQLLNITMSKGWPAVGQKVPVDITFAVRDGRGYLVGSEVSEHLRKLSLVEFSFYVGFPALQIAEPFYYPELNMSHHLRDTWVRTVLLGVHEQQVAERSFKARLERRLAVLLEEGLQETSRRRWRRATAVGNNSLQVVRISRLSGPERPLEVFYFVEGPGGERVPAEVTAATMNRLDLQRAAIVLGHRVQRPLAQPVETLSVPPAETQSSSIWLIVGVVVPVLLAVFIIIILYWKLCGSEKLEFQPDAINTIQQRQKLQAPSVKGFDFAKLHLGQHSKDDIMVIQETGPLPAPIKEATPSDGGDLNTPKSKGSSTKAARSSRRRGRLSPSDGDSLGSEQSSGRESAEESTRPVATPSEGKHHRKAPKNAVPSGSGPDELLSSSSIFDHVDRLSRGSSDGTRRQANKVQLIAMQPRPSPPAAHGPPQPSPSLTEKVNTEVVQQVALRHKSEIEHHRNKLRQRAKRRGQCEFPSMDDIMDAFGDGPVQSEAAQRLYSSAHDHMDCILQAEGASPLTPADSRKSSRGRRSPRGRRPHQGPGSLPDTDRDRLLTDQSATYRKYPGLNNVAYMSDPDLPPDHGSPSPTDEVFDSAPAPPPYMPPQPSIEEARQQMHSLLDDAFALVSPSSQASGVVSDPGDGQLESYPAAPQPQDTRSWESPPHPSRVCCRGGYVSTGEQLQESVYSNRGKYEDPPSSSRPRPVGGSTGAQLHHLTQVGLSSQIGAYPGVGRSMSGPTGSSWHQQHSDQDLSRPGGSRESVLSFPEFSSSSVFQMPSSSLRDPSAPPLLLTSPTPEYPPEDASPSAHTSASLIKAIREELRRLAQKQAAVTSYP